MKELLEALQRFIAGEGSLPEPGGETIPSIAEKELLILQLLIRKPNAYGLDLVRSSKGELKRGTVYVTLNRMEEKGFIISEGVPVAGDEDGPRQRRYRVSATGERLYRAHLIRKAAEGLAMGVQS